jgi:hypothetical protein
MDNNTSHENGAVVGGVRAWLLLEGVAMGAVALVGYRHLGGSWAQLAALFLVPDLSMLGYLAGPRLGAMTYNVAHAVVGPAVMATLGLAVPALLPYACIWLAHVGVDRALGYGLKYPSAFGATHLGRVGARVRGLAVAR